MTGAINTETEVFFYHLENRSLEQVLPTLLERSIERGWRAVVQASSKERVEALNTALWTFREDSFLPHGDSSDGTAAAQPIFLTDEEDNPNDASVRFLVDGATLEDAASYARVVHVFDGHDEDAVTRARSAWADAKDKGYGVSYWQQDGDGRWQKKA
ncbi:MAG: DNA polymerase III subunit chi [Hyphomicrobiaceae bacterium]|nr:DNA polymerase III subunit chi [Methyloceanibacter sp.]MDX2318105.1 DNA polymerase III subunit chi [Hyphomicrobiaceae bacterium]MDX2450139.1 DNA polymerase III subunit chi [Hyphomicrobiaceae bacterium]